MSRQQPQRNVHSDSSPREVIPQSGEKPPVGQQAGAEKRNGFSAISGSLGDRVGADKPNKSVSTSHSEEGAEKPLDPTKDRGGRPQVFDVFAKAKVVALIAAGVSQRTAANYLGIHSTTISKALKRDEAFREDVVRAQAVAKVHPMLAIKRASDTSWRAAVWMLKHGQPQTDLTEREERKRRRKGKRKFEREAAEFLSNMSEHLDQEEEAIQISPPPNYEDDEDVESEE